MLLPISCIFLYFLLISTKAAPVPTYYAGSGKFGVNNWIKTFPANSGGGYGKGNGIGMVFLFIYYFLNRLSGN